MQIISLRRRPEVSRRRFGIETLLRAVWHSPCRPNSPSDPLRPRLKADIVRLVRGQAAETRQAWLRDIETCRKTIGHDMIFASDNWAGAHPKVTAALATHGSGFATAYGDSDLDKAVALKIQRDLRARGRGVLRRHRHRRQCAVADACQQAGRRRLLPSRGACDRGRVRRAGIFHGRRAAVPGRRRRPAASIRPSLERAIARYPAEFVHSGRPIAVSITQSTEIGTVYGLDDIDAIAAICRKAAACRCTWTARVSPTRWCRSTRRRRR